MVVLPQPSKKKNVWGVTFSLLAEVQKGRQRGEKSLILPVPGPGLDIKNKKASSNRKK